VLKGHNRGSLWTGFVLPVALRCPENPGRYWRRKITSIREWDAILSAYRRRRSFNHDHHNHILIGGSHGSKFPTKSSVLPLPWLRRHQADTWTTSRCLSLLDRVDGRNIIPTAPSRAFWIRSPRVRDANKALAGATSRPNQSGTCAQGRGLCCIAIHRKCVTGVRHGAIDTRVGRENGRADHLLAFHEFCLGRL